MAKRSFEFKDDKSRKFWNIECVGPNHTVQYGRIGTQGRWNTKKFSNPEKAAKDSAKLIAQKLKKGYTEVTDKNAASPFEEVYLVSDKIFPVPVEEIDELEKTIGSLPYGYREFLYRCGGKGDLLDDVCVAPPNLIIQEVQRYREYMTFSHIEWLDDWKGLEQQDFENIWVFGSDGNGNDYCYFPRHVGCLFNLVHGGEVVRHDRAYNDVAQLWCSGRIRHPFPHFTPADRSVKRQRSLHHFRFAVDLSPSEVALLILDYWKVQGMDGKLVQMPAQHEGDDEDTVMAFVKNLGAWICASYERRQDPSQHGWIAESEKEICGVSGYFESDKEHHSAVRKCLKAIEQSLAP